MEKDKKILDKEKHTSRGSKLMNLVGIKILGQREAHK
jgi:hypothetical protein